MRILLTTTSFQDTDGRHHDLLKREGFEIVRERGPLPESRMLELAGDIDAFLCGDDKITQAVIDKALPRLKVISKYGVGLDKIDVNYVSKKGIPLTFCPGVNHTTVAEHTFALLLALSRNLITEANYCSNGEWVRITGNEIMGKTISIIGMGRIGKEVAVRARAFGMKVVGFDLFWDDEFATKNQVTRCSNIDEALSLGDVISLHVNLTEETRGLINKERINKMKKGAIILNCARGEIVNTNDLADALNNEVIRGYGADVLDQEPPNKNHPLLKAKNSVITPHIGSRTLESVQRQAEMAAKNLILTLKGKKPLAQAN